MCLFWCVCMWYMCLYMCICTYECTLSMHVVCGVQRSILGSFSQSFSTLLFETGSLTATGVHWFGQTGWQSDPEDSPASAHSAGIRMYVPTPGFLCGCWRSEFRPSLLVRQAFASFLIFVVRPLCSLSLIPLPVTREGSAWHAFVSGASGTLSLPHCLARAPLRPLPPRNKPMTKSFLSLAYLCVK